MVKQRMKHRDYHRERLNESKKRKEDRKARGRARYKLMKEGKVRVGDGKDVDHKKPLRSGGSNARSNLRVRSRSSNSADNGGKGGRPRKKRKT